MLPLSTRRRSERYPGETVDPATTIIDWRDLLARLSAQYMTAMILPDEKEERKKKSVLMMILGSALRAMMLPEKERMCPYMRLRVP
jgi:hypothetical protein